MINWGNSIDPMQQLQQALAMNNMSPLQQQAQVATKQGSAQPLTKSQPMPNVGMVSGGGTAQIFSGGSGPQSGSTPSVTGDLLGAQKAYENTQTTRLPGIAGGLEGLWDAAREGTKREELMAATDRYANDMEAKQEALKLQKQDAVYKTALQLNGGDKQAAKEVAALSINSPKAAEDMISQMTKQKYPVATDVSRNIAKVYPEGTPEYKALMEKVLTKGGTTVNVGTDNPFSESFSKLLEQGKTPVDPEAWLAGNTDAGVRDLTDVTKNRERKQETIQSAELVTSHTKDIRKILDDEGFGLPATGFGGALVRKGTQMLDSGQATGDSAAPGLFTRFTDAGEIDAKLEPIKSKIGLQTINQMRQMSASGGALGNVSNFEVRVVQAAIDSLDPNRGEEAFRSALNNVDTAFQRAAFVARHGEDMSEHARDNGMDELEFINKQLNDMYPLNPQFYERVQMTPIPWEADNTPPEDVQPGSTAPIQTDGWIIKEK